MHNAIEFVLTKLINTWSHSGN